MLIFKNVVLEQYLAEIKKAGAVTIPNFLQEKTRLALLSELRHYKMNEAPKELGPRKVKQAFRSLTALPPHSLFHVVRTELEKWFNKELSSLSPSPASETIRFNDLAVQTYEPGLLGISPHRDGKSFINLIAILILEGRGKFCLCEDGEGNGSQSLQNDSGCLILMRGSGFFGIDLGPYHSISHITERRTSFTLRQKKNQG